MFYIWESYALTTSLECSSWCIWRTQTFNFLDDHCLKSRQYHVLLKKTFALQRGFSALQSVCTEIVINLSSNEGRVWEMFLCLASAISYCYLCFAYFLESTFYSPTVLTVWITLCMQKCLFFTNIQDSSKTGISIVFCSL